MNRENPFARQSHVDTNVVEAIRWMGETTPEEIMEEREQATRKVERLAHTCWMTGEVETWFAEADPLVRNVSKFVNGPVFEKLANDIDFIDVACVDMFRCGVDFLGALICTGLGVARSFAPHTSIQHLKDTCKERSSKLVANLTEDKFSTELMATTVADSLLGRMTDPVELDALDPDSLGLAVRFGVEQGLREDGSVKIRAVDDETASGTNGCTEAM